MRAGPDSPLACQRHLFRIPPDVSYLNCAYMSPRLRAVTAAGRKALRGGDSPWTIRDRDWFRGAEELRNSVADLLGADADGIALVPAVSYGVALAAANLPVARGQNIVILDRQFPSNVYAWREVVQAAGAQLRTVGRPGAAETWTDALLAGIDTDTAVIAVPQCHWMDGSLVDLVAVGERARAVGAGLVVDASQSLGAFPLDVSAVQPDFLVSVGYKWLLGPYGLGYLYVAPRWRETGRPLEFSWLTRAGAEDFSSTAQYRDDFRAGARRFDMGEFPQFTLTPMASAALSQVKEWGVRRIQARLAGLTRALEERVQAWGWPVLPASKRVGHFVSFRVPEGLAERMAGRLREEKIFTSTFGQSIRVTPHVHNGDRDIQRLLQILAAFR